MMTKEYNSLDDFALWEIEAYLDNEPVAHLAEFLAQNPAAAQEVAQMKVNDATIQQAFYRFDCPEPSSLLAYQLGELEPVQQRAIADHLPHCPLCSGELADMQAFAAEPLYVEKSRESIAPKPAEHFSTPNLLHRFDEWIDQVRVVVATLVNPTGGQLAGVALRGETMPSTVPSPEMLLFETAEVDVSLTLNRRSDNSYRINGQIFTAMPSQNAEFVFTHADVTTSSLSGPISNTGTFIAGHLAPGQYQLVIRMKDQAIVIPNIQLEA